MKFISCLIAILSFVKGWPIEYAPWLAPLFELDTQFFYRFTEIDRLKSASEQFSFPDTHHTFGTTIEITPWPYWHVEAEVFLTQSNQISFSYEASRYCLRYSWLDNLDENLFALTSGILLTFPAKKFLTDRTFLYHGRIECELHCTLGKEWCCTLESLYRLWAMAAAGFAPRSTPWFHGLGCLEYLFSTGKIGLFIETFCGFGNHNLNITGPFRGYGSIDYKKLNAGLKAEIAIIGLGQLSMMGWYNLSSQNSTFHDWAIQCSLWMSFALL